MVITFRPEFSPPWIGQAHVTSVALSRLGNRETTALVGGITGGKALPQEILARIVERTDGIPLFVEELTKAVLEGGLLREEHGGYVLAGPLPQLAIPSSLQASLLARLDRLMPVKEVAQIGAALGREFSFELVNAVSLQTERNQLEALNQLTEAGLVFRRGAPPHATFIFKHALVQDAAYSTLLRAQRQELHARIGRVLEERYGEVAETQPETVAHHYTEAGLNELAVTYWHRAGERALQRSANAEAASHLTNAINLIATLPAGRDRDRRELSLQVALGLAMRAIKGHGSDETANVYARARDLLEETIPAKEQMTIFYGLWTVNVVRGEYDAGLSVAQHALTLSTQYQDAEASAFAHRMIGLTLWARGEFVQAVPHFERTIELYAPGHANVTDLRYSQDHAVWALSMLALVLYVLGYPERAEDAITKAISWARKLGHGMTAGFALGFGSILNGLLRFDQRWDGDFSEQVLAFCDEQDLQAFQPWALFYRGLALQRVGESPRALEMMQQGMDRAEKISMKMIRPLHLGYLADAHAGTGAHEAACELLDEASSIIGKTNERVFEAEVERIRGEILIRAGQVGQAEAALGRALHMARAQQARMYELRAATSLARLWRDQGKCTEARDLIAPIYGRFTEGFETADLKQANALLSEFSR
jgi:tetratricopeptide (TPR) repeat protein